MVAYSMEENPPTYLPIYREAKKLCPQCGNEFTGHLAKVYCSIRCRDKAKLQRAQARDTAAHPMNNKPQVGADMIIQNPTAEQLDEYASKLADGTISTAILFRGMIPEYWRPKQVEIMFVMQYDGATPKVPTEFSMFHERLLE